MRRAALCGVFALSIACGDAGQARAPEQPDAAALAAAEAGAVFQQRRRQFNASFRAGNHQQALIEAKKALSAAPILRDPYVWVSTLCTQLGRNQEAIRLFREVTQADPDLALPWYYKGFNEYHMNLFNDALTSFERASELDPTDAESWYRQGMIHYVKSDFERAAQTLEESYRLDPGSSLTAAKWIDVLRIQDEEERAMEIVDEALATLPEAAALLYRKGLLETKSGDVALAEQSFRAAVEHDPALREAHEHLARLLARTGRDVEAKRERNISERLGDYEKTRKTLEHRLADARDGSFPLLLAEVELTAGNDELAVRWFQRATRLGGHDPRVAAGLAEALYRLGRVEPADDALGRAAAGAARTMMSVVARELAAGNHERASKLLARLLPELPDERQLLRRAADYARELGELERSDELLDRALRARTLSTAPDDR